MIDDEILTLTLGIIYNIIQSHKLFYNNMENNMNNKKTTRLINQKLIKTIFVFF